MKFKRIAVLIRGHKRTWDWCKHNIFHVYENIAEQVEWYFVTWQTPDLNLIQLKQDFRTKNLIDIITVPTSWYNYFNVGPPPYGQDSGPWYSPAWLSYNALPSKKLRQQHVNYDAVFDQRPDAIPYISTPYFKNIDATTLYSTAENLSEVNDIGFMSDSRTYDILASRFTYPFAEDHKPETLFAEFCQSSNINIKLGFLDYVVIRPDIFKHYPESFIPASNTQWEDIKNMSGPDIRSTWGKLSRTEQIAIMHEHNISLWDYYQKDDIRKQNGFQT